MPCRSDGQVYTQQAGVTALLALWKGSWAGWSKGQRVQGGKARLVAGVGWICSKSVHMSWL